MRWGSVRATALPPLVDELASLPYALRRGAGREQRAVGGLAGQAQRARAGDAGEDFGGGGRRRPVERDVIQLHVPPVGGDALAAQQGP